MRLLHIVRSRIRSIFLPGRREADLREELQGHLDQEAEHLHARGLPEEAAHREAIRTFGGVEQTKDACRDARGTGVVDAVSRDVRHGVRRLARDWAFSAAAILILGLGIGVNTASFSAINAILFRPLAFVDTNHLADIYQRAANDGINANSYPVYLDIAAYTDVFEGTTAASIPMPANFFDRGMLRPAVTEYTTASYPSVLGLPLTMGRWFTAQEEVAGAPVVAIVGHQAWTTRFDGDPSVVGRTIRIEGVPVTIVGVGPAGYNGTLNVGVVTDFWLPIPAVVALGGPPRVLDRRPVESAFFVKARLREGVTVAQAQAAMDSLGARLARDYPKEDPGKGIAVLASSEVRVHPQMDVPLMAFSAVLIVVVGLVLAIACSNLATLLLVRGTSRAKEISVRLALGATRAQLVRHLLTESLLLSLAGGAAGCLLAWWAIRSVSLVELPVAVDLSLDYRVFTFAVILALGTSVAFGLAPALKATRIDLVPTLRDEGGSRSHEFRWFTLKNALVVFQVAVSVVLLFATSIVLQQMLAARAQVPGYAVDGVAILQTDARYVGHSAEAAGRVYEELLRRVTAIPGVQSATAIAGEPMVTSGLPILVEGQDTGDRPSVVAASIWAAARFFETLQIPVLFGRALDERDRPDTPRTAVVSESMARAYFGGVNAVGRRFRIDQDPNWIEVVGVVKDTKTADLTGDLVDPTPSMFYRASTQVGRAPSTIVARTSLDASGLVTAMQRELRGIDAGLPVLTAQTMRGHIEESLFVPSAVATFLGVLGSIGASLAGIGLYAVVAFAVSRRTREIGIRMALGAGRPQVVWSVVREVLILVGAGTAAGLMLAALVRLLLRASSSPAPGVQVYRPLVDPFAFLAITGFMAAVGLAAAYIPARRAARLNPLTALRHD